uniref:Uncharacterized protein n=1 Tax=Anguilla anguilla TaxID=7936 RepID=A0A0E9VCF8_ANGAN
MEPFSAQEFQTCSNLSLHLKMFIFCMGHCHIKGAVCKFAVEHFCLYMVKFPSHPDRCQKFECLKRNIWSL